MTTRANIYPLNTTTPVQLTREPYYNVGSGAFVLGELSRGFFGSTDFEIWSAETGGTQLTEGVDYTLGGLNSYYTALAGQSVYTTATISNVSYQSGPIYITYKTIGTFTSAPFYNAMQDGSNALMNQGIINGCMRVSTQASASLSTSFQEGEVNKMACKGSGTAVTAGTIEQATAANAGVSGFDCKVTGATITGTGIVHLRYRMESKDAKEYKNQNATIALLVYHDVGSAVDYTIYVSKADAEDDFSSVTAIGNNSGQTVSNATETIIYYKDISLGDCSNGIEIEIQAECGAITTKNFEFAEFRISKTDIILPFQARHIEAEKKLCNIETGWIPLSDTLTYASATTITTASDLTGFIEAGMKLKITQPTDGVKYFVVIAITSSLITISTGTYDLDNEAITSPYYSMAETPYGWPYINGMYVKVSDVKATGTGGGTFTSGVWQTRDINTEDNDDFGICSISSNQITLSPGTYTCHITCPAFLVDRHQARLYDTTGTSVLLQGQNAFTDNVTGGHSTSSSVIIGQFTLSVESVLEIQHRCETTGATNGFGIDNSFGGDEVYTVAEFLRRA